MGSSHELLPLPALPLPSLPTGRSRGARQKASRNFEAVQHANRIIASLNKLGGGGSSVVQSGPPNTSAKASVLQHVLECAKRDRPPSEAPSPEEAFSLLLGTPSSLYESESESPMVPFDVSLLSLPSTAGGCDLQRALEGPDLLDYKRFESRLMLGEAEFSKRVSAEGRARAFWAPELDDPHTYIEFVRNLHARNMLTFSFTYKCMVGCFAVAKTSGRQRLIIDCRKLNQCLRPPPKTRLATCGAFSELCV
jgi:hypothetical protein